MGVLLGIWLVLGGEFSQNEDGQAQVQWGKNDDGGAIFTLTKRDGTDFSKQDQSDE